MHATRRLQGSVELTGRGLFLAGAGAVVLLGTAGFARAGDVAPPKAEFASSEQAGPWAAPTPHKTYAFDSKGRWGVKLDLAQPTNRDPDWKDAQVGAYLRITPKFRVGGSVGLGDKFAQPQHLTPEDTAPRVHLEGAFKF